MHIKRFAIVSALVLSAGTGVAAAQNAPKQESAPPNQSPSSGVIHQPEANNPTPAQVAPAEPKALPLPQTGPAFVNGALAAPGAAQDAQTAPSKYSAKNAAADHAPLLEYTFKDLSDDQRRTIYAGVTGAKFSTGTVAKPDLYAAISVQLPPSIELHEVPQTVSSAVPETSAFRCTILAGKVLLVDPNNRTVVAVIGQ